jgi:hypothetical protein
LGLIIYPNPADNLLHVKIPGNADEKAKLIITDILGRQVFIKEINKFMGDYTVDVNNFKSGVYCVSIIGDQLHTNQKFLKQ